MSTPMFLLNNDLSSHFQGRNSLPNIVISNTLLRIVKAVSCRTEVAASLKGEQTSWRLLRSVCS